MSGGKRAAYWTQEESAEGAAACEHSGAEKNMRPSAL